MRSAIFWIISAFNDSSTSNATIWRGSRLKQVIMYVFTPFSCPLRRTVNQNISSHSATLKLVNGLVQTVKPLFWPSPVTICMRYRDAFFCMPQFFALTFPMTSTSTHLCVLPLCMPISLGLVCICICNANITPFCFLPLWSHCSFGLLCSRIWGIFCRNFLLFPWRIYIMPGH